MQMWKHLYVMDRIQLTEMTENNLVNWIHHAVESNIIILVGKGLGGVGGGVSRRETEREREGEREKRGWRNGREGTKEVEDRAHFSAVLSNGTSSISPKRSLQSTKLLISNERPWNTVAKQLGGGEGGTYWAADSRRSVSIISISPHLIDFHSDEQRPARSDQAQENGLLRQRLQIIPP